MHILRIVEGTYLLHVAKSDSYCLENNTPKIEEKIDDNWILIWRWNVNISDMQYSSRTVTVGCGLRRVLTQSLPHTLYFLDLFNRLLDDMTYRSLKLSGEYILQKGKPLLDI